MYFGSENVIKKPTDELMKELLNSNNISKYIKENEQYFIDLSLQEFLNEYVKTKKLVKTQILKDAEINEIYGYQIFSGARTPSRNKLISICVGMGMSIDEVQSTIKIAGFAPLYPKTKRDSIIIHGIVSGNKVCDINNELYDNEEETL